ncbi:hypothetical protein [uncultured Kordia sp.]|uniref:type II secretion system protein n=1 Tax=uncultured Kordia sp. TaxID=507699 RepID=UPI002604A641|nr:hypothetical protein [uncultured Kordia sp.]
MKSLKNFKKLRASSLLESVMATAIIAICVIMATIVFVNVFKTAHSTAFFEGSQQIQTIITELQKKQKITEKTYSYPNYTIEQKVSVYDKSTNIKHVQLELITNQERKTFQYLLKVRTDEFD